MLFRAIITTNIDTLIEDAFQKYACEKIKVWTQNDINENLELFEMMMEKTKIPV